MSGCARTRPLLLPRSLQQVCAKHVTGARCHFAAGVDKVLVVDVEDRDDSAYREVTPIHGGVSGWRMLWDRLCPFERLRCALQLASNRDCCGAFCQNTLARCEEP